MAGTIYLVTNTLNGKQYVGQTIVAGNRVGHGKLITKAYNKYGKDSFDYVPVCNNIENHNTLNFMEKFWIKVMDCRIPNGYNIEHGGSKVEKIADETRAILSAKSKGNQRRLGTKQSEATKALMSAQRRNPSAEYRRRLSEAQKGRTFSAETIEKIRLGNQGKVVSEETKAKLSSINKGKTFSMETKQKLSDAAKRQWARQRGEI
jgi:hypothetical protein